jgi:peptide/nickel transport system substrate-binding protein
MRGLARRALFVVLAALVLGSATVLAACGGGGGSSNSSSSASTSSSSTTAKNGGTITIVFGTAPDSLDPGFGYTTQAAEPDWLSYTGLATYAHKSGTAGGALIPGLAEALPQPSADGKTYTATLRKGLTFSDGKPVKASDFAYTVERALKIPWGGSGQFIAGNIAGAKAYASGKAKSISGITTDDATGKITIKLLSAYGAFNNVLAFPSLGLVPSGTPMKNEPNNPPPGVGPYSIKNVVPNQSFELIRNPKWGTGSLNIPGIPAGHVDIKAKISSNVDANALSVVNNQADVYDWADIIPGSLLPQIQSRASSRYAKKVMNSTYYVFMNTKEKPFNNQLARQAVVTGLNQNAMSRLSSGSLIPGCYFLPPGMVGHPTTPCPYGDPAKGGDIAKAKQLVKQSGMAGQPVTVWSQQRAPRQQWMTYYTSFLNQIGFKAKQKLIADASYFPTIGNLKGHPQTGFADWNQDFPNPIDFYLLVQGSSILPTNNENFGEVDDPQINQQSAKLGAVPTNKLSTIASQWQSLDEYLAKKAYIGVFGYQTFPALVSDRMSTNYVFHPLYGWDWSSFSLK